MNPKTLDHVAYWLEDRDAVADFVVRHLGMHVIERTDAFTLVGADARRGKLTLFAAEGPREAGPLEHVALRVADLGSALARLPEALSVERRRAGGAYFEVGQGVVLGLVESAAGQNYDLDHVTLRSADPEATAVEYESLGFRPAAAGPSGCRRVEVGGAWIEFQPGAPSAPERPLLNHLAVLVDSADDHLAAAQDLGVEVEKVVDAPNTLAVFLRGPEGVRIEYVEHKPTFSLT
ncbi:MAG TPA: VOC family protein [Gaiellaceae bacterium]|nr:VOC family protein [Gaiellaceae bacterium]